MVKTEGDLIMVNGVLLAAGPSEYARVEIYQEDADYIRKLVKPMFEGQEDKKTPSWVRGRGKVLSLTSTYDVHTSVYDTTYNSVNQVCDIFGLLRGSSCLVAFKVKKTKAGNTGVFLHEIIITKLESCAIDEFW